VILDAYVDGLRDRTTKGNSHRSAESKQRMLESVFGADFDVSRMTDKDLGTHARIRRRRDGVENGTINGDFRVLKAAMHHAARKGGPLRGHPDLVEIKELKQRKGLPDKLSDAQVHRLFEAAAASWDVALLLAMKAGLRREEIMMLRVEDVDFDHRMIEVRSKTSERHGVAWEPKDWECRSVPFAEQLSLRLKDHIATLRGAWLFPKRRDPHQPVTSAMDKAMKKIWERAGLRDTRKPGLHQLRRTWASQMHRNGASLETVRELGGWDDLNVVKRYVSAYDEEKREAVESLDP